MAKIQEVAGVIDEALRLRPGVVEGHVRGLRAAERFESDEIGPIEVADLLIACLCTDPNNATAAFHLPFAGAECAQAFLEPFAEELSPYRANAGQVLALHLNPKTIQFGCAEDLTIAGADAHLRLMIDAMVPCLGTVRLWFGYDMLPALAHDFPKLGVLETRSIAGAAIRRVGSTLANPLMDSSYRMFLRAALKLNTPTSHESVTVH